MTALDLPDIRSASGDCSSVAALYTLADYYGIAPHGGGAFEALLHTSQARKCRPAEVKAALVDIGLRASATSGMGLEAVEDAARDGRPVLCVTKGKEYVVVAGVEKGRRRRQDAPGQQHFIIHDPRRGRLSLPESVFQSLFSGEGLILEKAQHGGRGGGMVGDTFQTHHPMPKGSTVIAREGIATGYVPGQGFGFEVAAGDRLEVLDHRGGDGKPQEVRVRNKAGQEAWLLRSKLRGKTTGRGHKTPESTGREAPGYSEKPHEEAEREMQGHLSHEHPKRSEWHRGGGTCKPGQTAAQTHCTPAR